MYKIEIEEKLGDKLKKLFRKDKNQYEAIMKKMEEIIQQPQHYKPLSNEMKQFRRVHILKSFVLVFKIDEDRKVVMFTDYDHHDNIYKMRT